MQTASCKWWSGWRGTGATYREGDGVAAVPDHVQGVGHRVLGVWVPQHVQPVGAVGGAGGAGGEAGEGRGFQIFLGHGCGGLGRGGSGGDNLIKSVSQCHRGGHREVRFPLSRQLAGKVEEEEDQEQAGHKQDDMLGAWTAHFSSCFNRLSCFQTIVIHLRTRPIMNINHALRRTSSIYLLVFNLGHKEIPLNCWGREEWALSVSCSQRMFIVRDSTNAAVLEERQLLAHLVRNN